MYELQYVYCYALVFPTGVDEHQFPITQKMVVSSVMYDECILPVVQDTLVVKKTITHKDGQQSLTYPDATTGTYAGRCAPPRAQIYSKCA